MSDDIFARKRAAISLCLALLLGAAIARPAVAQPAPAAAPGIWNYTRQDDIHKATVADLAGFFQVQCRAAKVSLIVLINSEGPLPTAGGQTGVDQTGIDAQIRFEGKTFPIVMNEQPKYARTTGPIHTTVFLLSVKEHGLDILTAIKKAHAFLIDQGATVSAFSAKGSGAAIGELEKNCAAG